MNTLYEHAEDKIIYCSKKKKTKQKECPRMCPRTILGSFSRTCPRRISQLRLVAGMGTTIGGPEAFKKKSLEVLGVVHSL
jgi:hypothetical protein